MADETPVGGGGSEGGDAFNILGRIEVDLDALRKSLDTSKGMVQENAGELKRIWTEAVKVSREEIKIPGGGGGEGEGGGGGEGGARHSATAEFAHMARVVRHSLVPALAAINPELAQFISAGAASARTAVFFGGAIGVVAVATATLSVIVAKYVGQAKEQTAATLDSARALSTLDAGRAEAGLKQLAETYAAYNLAVKESGDTSLGFWQRVVAWSTVAVEAVTGHLDVMIKKFQEYAVSSAKISEEISIPKARVEAGKASAEILSKEADRAMRSASSQAALAAAYELSRKAAADKNKEDLRGLDIKEKEQLRPIGAMGDALRTKLLADAEAKRKAEIQDIEQPSGFAESPEGRAILAQRKAQTEADFESAKKKIETDVDAYIQVLSGKVRGAIGIERGTKGQQLAESEAASRDKERKDMAELEAGREVYFQHDVQRNQKRAEVAAATAEAVAAAEDTVAKIRREHEGDVESVSAMEERLARTRESAVGPLVAGLKAANAEYESQARAFRARAEAGITSHDDEEKFADLKKQHDEDVIERQLRIRQVTAQRMEAEAQAARQRDQEAVTRQDQVLAHRVAMGRVTMQDQMGSAAAGQYDPRRTRAQQEQQEEMLLALKRDYADRYFKYQTQLGASTWDQQIESAKSFLGQTVEGSKSWFDAVSKVFDVYKAIHDQAQGVAQQMAGIAAGEAGRAGRTRTSLREVDALAGKARERDAAIMRGGSAAPGDVTAAVGRQDFWKTMDRSSGLWPSAGPAVFGATGGFRPPGAAGGGAGSFGEAFATAQMSPQDRLMGTMAEVATRQSAVAERQGAASEKFSSAVDKFEAAVDKFAAGRAGEDTEESGAGRNAHEGGTGNIGGTEQEGDRAPIYVLSTEPGGGRKYTNIDNAEDAKLGRSLFLAGKRGPSTQATIP